MSIEKEFVPYNESLELKELGFYEPCLGYWSNWGTQEPFLLTCELGTEKESCAIKRKNLLCSAPTFSQAFRFFREKYDLHVQIGKENYFQQSAYEYFHFDISRGQENDITRQEDLLNEIFDESSQDIPGNHLNDEKFSRLIFERKFAFKTHEETELECLRKLIKIVKDGKNTNSRKIF